MNRPFNPALILVLALLFGAGRALFGSSPGETGPTPTGGGSAAALVLNGHTGRSSASRASAGSPSDETVIERDGSGQFHLQAQVNGEDTEFLVDTGADLVALTETDAERLGLDVSPDDFRPIMQTASGVGKGALVRLDRLELGDEEFHDVRAVVVQGLDVNLLGQSVLRRLGGVEMQGDRMVIAHR